MLVCRAFRRLRLLFALAFALVLPSRESRSTSTGPAPEHGDAAPTPPPKSQYSTGCTYRRTVDSSPASCAPRITTLTFAWSISFDPADFLHISIRLVGSAQIVKPKATEVTSLIRRASTKVETERHLVEIRWDSKASAPLHIHTLRLVSQICVSALHLAVVNVFYFAFCNDTVRQTLHHETLNPSEGHVAHVRARKTK